MRDAVEVVAVADEDGVAEDVGVFVLDGVRPNDSEAVAVGVGVAVSLADDVVVLEDVAVEEGVGDGLYQFQSTL